jgi:hypothetical protein
VQYVPDLIERANVSELARLGAFQAKVLLASLWSLKHLEPSLRTLGLDPRALADSGEALCRRTLEDLTKVNGGDRIAAVAGPAVTRSFLVVKELMFPMREGASLFTRIRGAGRAVVLAN